MEEEEFEEDIKEETEEQEEDKKVTSKENFKNMTTIRVNIIFDERNKETPFKLGKDI